MRLDLAAAAADWSRVNLKSNLTGVLIRRRDFPGGPVVKNPCFQCKGCGFDPWPGNYDPTCSMVCQKKKGAEIWTQILREEGHVVPEAETIHQQYRYDISVYQGMARIVDNHQNLGRNKERFFPGNFTGLTALDFGFLASRNGLPKWLKGKESACNAGDSALIPGLGRSPGGGNGNPLWYSCLENPMDRGAWWATVHGVAKSWT